jgi:hypothetical protein
MARALAYDLARETYKLQGGGRRADGAKTGRGAARRTGVIA